MHIVETFDVTFTGPAAGLYTDLFIVQQDDGKILEAHIPRQGNLVEQFRWLSDNDCLRYLRKLEPDFCTNSDEIHEIQKSNYMMEEHFHLAGQNNFLDEVPDYVYTATWTFVSRPHAIMFKLATGGEQ